MRRSDKTQHYGAPETMHRILEVIHLASDQLLGVKNEYQAYQIMNGAINAILPGVYFVITKLQPDDLNFRITEHSNFGTVISGIIKVIGKDPREMDFPFADLTESQLISMRNRQVKYFPGRIYELTHGKVSKTISKALEKLLDIVEVCSFSISVENQFYGAITLFITKKLITEGYHYNGAEMAIETITNMASAVIQKLRDDIALIRKEEALIHTNQQIKTLIEYTGSGFILEDNSRKILMVNNSFCRIFNIPSPDQMIGMDCREATKLVADLFLEPDRFINEIDDLIKENKTIIDQEILMQDGRILVRDFIPSKDQVVKGYIWQYRDITERVKSEKDLLISNARFNQVVSQLNDLVWKANGDGSEFSDLSNSFEKIFGFPLNEYVKSEFWLQLVHPEDKEIAKKSFSELFTTGKSTSEYRIIRTDGSTRWIHDHKALVSNKKGEPIQMGGIVSDITEKKLLEEQLLIKDHALDASPTAVILADLTGSIVYANNAFVRLWGYNGKNEVIGRKIKEFSAAQENVDRALATINQRKNYFGETKAVRKDGDIFDIHISASIVLSTNGMPIYAMALFVDITERKRMELKLSEQTEQLKEMNATKDKFFFIIAHDLKAPFNSLLGFTDLLSTDYNDLSEDQIKRVINSLDIAAHNAYKLLDNLLEWAMLQRGHLEIHKVMLNLKDLIDESIELLLPISVKKGISVVNNISVDLLISVDYYSIKTIIGNLFNNAIKYTFTGGRVEFNALEGNGTIEISIRDTGVGMSPKVVGKLFRLDESQSTLGTNQEKGTGLGLIICKDLINKNEGIIKVESEKGYGSVFTISLPSHTS